MTLAGAMVDVLLPETCPGCNGLPGISGQTRLCPNCDALVPRLPRLVEVPRPLRMGWVLGPYEGPLGALVRRAKYRPDPAVVVELAHRLAQATRGRLPPIDAVVPVPIPARRRMWRGFDQGEYLARAVARAQDRPLIRALKRVNPEEQAGRSARERRARAAGSFRCTAPHLPPRVLLVDDVLTTGATVAACADELLAAGAQAVLAVFVAGART